MNYYVLELRSKFEKDISFSGITYDANQEVVEDVFFWGNSITKIVHQPFTVILDERSSKFNKLLDRITIDTNRTGLVLLVSPEAQKILKQLNLPIEFIDVVIKSNKIELKDYKFVNVIGRINCVDKQKSELEYLRENIILIYDKLVLDNTKIPSGTEIFLLGEDNTMLVIVSERVKNAIESSKLSGFEFKKPEDYKSFR
jgi:hypothetical protein